MDKVNRSPALKALLAVVRADIKKLGGKDDLVGRLMTFNPPYDININCLGWLLSGSKYPDNGYRCPSWVVWFLCELYDLEIPPEFTDTRGEEVEKESLEPFPDCRSFGEAITTVCKNLGISQRDMEIKAGIDTGNISSLRGQKPISLAKAEKLCAETRIDPCRIPERILKLAENRNNAERTRETNGQKPSMGRFLSVLGRPEIVTTFADQQEALARERVRLRGLEEDLINRKVLLDRERQALEAERARLLQTQQANLPIDLIEHIRDLVPEDLAESVADAILGEKGVRGPIPSLDEYAVQRELIRSRVVIAEQVEAISKKNRSQRNYENDLTSTEWVNAFEQLQRSMDHVATVLLAAAGRRLYVDSLHIDIEDRALDYALESYRLIIRRMKSWVQDIALYGNSDSDVRGVLVERIAQTLTKRIDKKYQVELAKLRHEI